MELFEFLNSKETSITYKSVVWIMQPEDRTALTSRDSHKGTTTTNTTTIQPTNPTQNTPISTQNWPSPSSNHNTTETQGTTSIPSTTQTTVDIQKNDIPNYQQEGVSKEKPKTEETSQVQFLVEALMAASNNINQSVTLLMENLEDFNFVQCVVLTQTLSYASNQLKSNEVLKKNLSQMKSFFRKKFKLRSL